MLLKVLVLQISFVIISEKVDNHEFAQLQLVVSEGHISVVVSTAFTLVEFNISCWDIYYYLLFFYKLIIKDLLKQPF